MVLTLKEMTPPQKKRYYADLKKWQQKGLSKWEAVKAARRTVTYNYDSPEFKKQIEERRKRAKSTPITPRMKGRL